MSEIKLTIDEVIEHCERVVNNYSRMDIGKEIVERGTESCFVKQYLEHKQVAEWLKELKNLRGAMERILTRLEEESDEWRDTQKQDLDNGYNNRFACGMTMGLDNAVDICKEEGANNE